MGIVSPLLAGGVPACSRFRQRPRRCGGGADSTDRTTPGAAGRRPAAIGMTILELVLVVGIIAVLSAIAIPRFANAIQGNTLDRAADRVAAAIRTARAGALRSRQSHKVVIDTTANTCTLWKICAPAADQAVPDPDHPGQAYVLNAGDAPYRGVRIASTDFADNTVTFDRFGSPAAGGTITISLGTRSRTIRVMAGSGRVKVD